MPGGYTVSDFQKAIRALPQEGLEESATALVRALESAGEHREEYWDHHVKPFWDDVWPKSLQLASTSLAEVLARLCIAAQGRFPAALDDVFDWLKPFEEPMFVIHSLRESGLSKRFPEDALRLLDAIIEDQPWASSEVGDCLNQIVQEKPELKSDLRYQRLQDYVRRYGT